MVDNLDICGVDVGDGKDWWYVHGLTTHDKVYELNKQMCDIEKTLLTNDKDMEHRISDIIANIMMNGKVNGQDVKALTEMGIPSIDLMLSSLNVGLFVKNIVDWKMKNNQLK